MHTSTLSHQLRKQCPKTSRAIPTQSSSEPTSTPHSNLQTPATHTISQVGLFFAWGGGNCGQDTSLSGGGVPAKKHPCSLFGLSHKSCGFPNTAPPHSSISAPGELQSYGAPRPGILVLTGSLCSGKSPHLPTGLETSNTDTISRLLSVALPDTTS